MRCVTHLSPQTQNELIEVMDKHIILKGTLEDLNAATYYSILAGEVTLHKEGILLLVLGSSMRRSKRGIFNIYQT